MVRRYGYNFIEAIVAIGLVDDIGVVDGKSGIALLVVGIVILMTKKITITN